MKSKIKKNVANLNNQQQNRTDTQNKTDHRANNQHAADEAAPSNSNKADAQNNPQQTGRSGRKSRDNFGSYKGY